MSARRLAENGKNQIKKAVIALLEQKKPLGLKNAEISRQLGLRCDDQDGQRNWITWTVLRELVTEKVVKRRGASYRLIDRTAQRQ